MLRTVGRITAIILMSLGIYYLFTGLKGGAIDFYYGLAGWLGIFGSSVLFGLTGKKEDPDSRGKAKVKVFTKNVRIRGKIRVEPLKCKNCGAVLTVKDDDPFNLVLGCDYCV